MKKFISHIPPFLPSLLITVFIIYLSIDSNPLDANSLHLFPGADKLVHFIMYFSCVVVYVGEYGRKRFPHHTKLNFELLWTSLAIVLGLMMEVVQLMVPELGRGYELADWYADIAGALTAFLLMHYKLLHWMRHHFFYNKYYHRHRHHHHHHHDQGPKQS